MAGGESLQHYITTLFVWREAFLLVFSLNNKELTEELFDANHREQLSFNVTSRHAQVSKNTTFRSVSEHRQGKEKAVFPSTGRQMRGGSTVKLPASVASAGRGPDTNFAAGKLRKTLKKPRHKHLPATGRESVQQLTTWTPAGGLVCGIWLRVSCDKPPRRRKLCVCSCLALTPPSGAVGNIEILL